MHPDALSHYWIYGTIAPGMLFKPEQLPAFRTALLAWFRQFQRDLPWRRTRDAYRIWISEIMLQQTRVATVIPYYERFIERFPNVRSLASAPEEEILRLWSGLGYYSRARNLQKAAQQIVALHGGEFPRDEEAVRQLSGIGSYTAAAILSIAFLSNHAVLDGNVARVLARLGALRGDLREARRWQSLQAYANELLAAEAPGDWNQAMMELGATLCTPRAPQCLLCPVTNFCRARRLGDPQTYPDKRKKRAPVQITLAAAVLCNGRKETLLLPPPSRGKSPSADDVATLVSCMWHFPTIPVRQDAESELRKHLTDLIDDKKRALRLKLLSKVRHSVTYRNITILPFSVCVATFPRLPGAKTTSLTSFGTLPVSNLTRKIARAALQGPTSKKNARSASPALAVSP